MLVLRNSGTYEITSCSVLAKNFRETQTGLVSLESSPNLIVNHLIYTPLALWP